MNKKEKLSCDKENLHKNTIHMIGMGPGNPDLVMPLAVNTIRSCEIIFGSQRLLEMIKKMDPSLHINKRLIEIDHDLEKLSVEIIKEVRKAKIAILVTGDSGYYSLAAYLRTKFNQQKKELEIRNIPGISSLQYLAASAGLSWQNIKSISLHGRNHENWWLQIKENKYSAILSGNDPDMQEILIELSKVGFGDWTGIIGQRLSYSDEKIEKAKVKTLISQKYDSLSIMILIRPEQEIEKQKSNNGREVWPWLTPGIDDSCFIRGDVPMTKQDIRAAVICHLQLSADDIVWDIGAGTGSVSIEAARICSQGKIFSIEKNDIGCNLIKENSQVFGLNNIEIIHGNAPQALTDIPDPDRIFIGGSGANTGEIIEYIIETIQSRIKTEKKTRLVMTSVTLETIPNTLEILHKKNIAEIEIKQIQINSTRPAGSKTMVSAQTPVWVLAADL